WLNYALRQYIAPVPAIQRLPASHLSFRIWNPDGPSGLCCTCEMDSVGANLKQGGSAPGAAKKTRDLNRPKPRPDPLQALRVPPSKGGAKRGNFVGEGTSYRNSHSILDHDLLQPEVYSPVFSFTIPRPRRS